MASVIRSFVVIFIGVCAVSVMAAILAVWYLVPRLPSIEILKDVRLQVPLRVYTRNERLVAEFGEKRRTPVTLEEVPDKLVKALLAAEDDRFFEHPGVDWQGLTRAVMHLLRTGEKGPGGSTITMQVARNFFLSREKTYLRKLNEILLALKIERELDKKEILELYLNKIFLGHRAYGVGAAAQTYYSAGLDDLSLAQLAMIAGLPKAPSRFNPIVNPERALTRRGYVLGRMRELKFIDEEEFQGAMAAPVTARLRGLIVEVEAPYVAEMVRSFVESRYGAEAYTSGYRVITTLDSRLQETANASLREGLLEYDARHGYKGPELNFPLPSGSSAMDELLADIPDVGNLAAAIVTHVEERTVTAYTSAHGAVVIPWTGLSWARPYVNENRRGKEPGAVADILQVGDLIRIRMQDDHWHLAQVPQVEGALVALDPLDGAIRALVGGFDFYKSKFNRVTQAERQPGSSFKPFVYSAALARGYTAASIINDAPVVFDDPGLEAAWRPENYSGKFFGPTRLREALTRSRNLVSIRLLRAVGISSAIDHVRQFGFDTQRLPRNLSLALGSGGVTPLELARGYAVFANGGYRVEPFFVERMEELDGAVAFRASPVRVCTSCEGQVEGAPSHDSEGPSVQPRSAGNEAANSVPQSSLQVAQRVVDVQNVWIMNSMMRDVIKRGTGRRAMALGRTDLSGKTGTTNDQRDAWFSGFNSHLVTTAWVGFDQHKPLGNRETGARAALPVWMKFMAVALEDTPEEIMEAPDGLVTVRIDPITGQLASASDPEAIFEIFRAREVPKSVLDQTTSARPSAGSGGGNVTERLF